MPLRVYNTMSGEKEVFKPLEEGKVKMYACGPTVYDVCHIGHARATTVFDVIVRYLRYSGFDVTYVRNITDIDDKIIKKANEEGVSWDAVAERYTKEFWEDMKALGNLPPSIEPKATEYIPNMHKLIQTLIDKGFAYVVDGDVYFSVRKFPSYGRLSKRNMDELMAGARVEVDERKADPLDFALWKSSKPGEPWWDSPWGKGRPGWHIECSAMTMKNLGQTFDIHGGGKDLIFPHHENEIAQSEAASGKTFARYWLHNGFINIEREKMSKSLGNIVTIKNALKNFSAEAIRLFLLSSHYRSPIDYSPEVLQAAEAELDRFYRTLERMEKDWPDVAWAPVSEEVKKEILQPYINVMDDDFNMAAVVGFIFQRVNEVNRLMDYATRSGVDEEFKKELPRARVIFEEISRILGVFNRTSQEYFEERRRRVQMPLEEIERLISERNEARKAKDFKRADEIRSTLLEKGIVLEDTPKGAKWKVK